MGRNVTHTILYFYNLASPRTKSAARAGAAFLAGAALAVLATACSPAHAEPAARGTIAPKPKGPVLVTPKSEAVAAPTDERGFFTPEFLPMPEIRLRMVLGAGSAYPQGRRQGFGLVTTPRAHQFRPSQALDGFLVTPEGAKTMTHVTQGKTTPTQSPQNQPNDVFDRIAMGLPASAASAVHHAALAEEAAKPNLQKLSMEFEAAGFNHDLIFRRNQVQSLASRLRGISAIGAVLSAGTWGDAVDIGGTLQAGLLDALNSLVKDAYQEIELTDVHACEAQEEAKRQGGAA